MAMIEAAMEPLGREPASRRAEIVCGGVFLSRCSVEQFYLPPCAARR